MRIKLPSALIVTMATLALAGCGDKSAKSDSAKAPAGQVIATVGGDEITVHELNAELRGVQLPDGEARKEVERQALQAIVNRKIVAAEAIARKVDQTPGFILQDRRQREGLLAQMLQASIAGQAGAPDREAAEAYISKHPELFAERKFYVLDQIQFPMPSAEVIKAMEPLKSLDQIEQLLSQRNIEYRRAPASVDTLQMPRALNEAITKLPAGEVFILPSGGIVTANQIKEARPMPFIGEPAVSYAQQRIRSEQAAELVEKDLGKLVEEKKKTVVYQDGYGPPKTAEEKPEAPKPPVPAAAAPPAAATE